MKKQYLIVYVCRNRTTFKIEKYPRLITDADGIVPFEGLCYDIYETLEGGALKKIQSANI